MIIHAIVLITFTFLDEPEGLEERKGIVRVEEEEENTETLESIDIER